MVAILLAASREGVPVGLVGVDVEQIGVAVIAADTIALKIGEVATQGRGSEPNAVVANDAGLDHHPPRLRPKPGAQPSVSAAAASADVPASPAADRLSGIAGFRGRSPDLGRQGLNLTAAPPGQVFAPHIPDPSRPNLELVLSAHRARLRSAPKAARRVCIERIEKSAFAAGASAPASDEKPQAFQPHAGQGLAALLSRHPNRGVFFPAESPNPLHARDIETTPQRAEVASPGRRETATQVA
jgi:hypothetical protein